MRNRDRLGHLAYLEAETKRLGAQVDELRQERNDILDAVMSVFGLKDVYPDRTEETVVNWSRGAYATYESVSYPSLPTMRSQAIFGREDFIKDLMAAKDAANGAEALKKIRDSMKGKN